MAAEVVADSSQVGLFGLHPLAAAPLLEAIEDLGDHHRVKAPRSSPGRQGQPPARLAAMRLVKAGVGPTGQPQADLGERRSNSRRACRRWRTQDSHRARPGRGERADGRVGEERLGRQPEHLALVEMGARTAQLALRRSRPQPATRHAPVARLGFAGAGKQFDLVIAQARLLEAALARKTDMPLVRGSSRATIYPAHRADNEPVASWWD